MAHSVVTLIIIIAFAGIGAGLIRLATARAARARERAGLPARVPVKLPLYWWAFMILVIVNSAFLLLRSHGAP